jgi:hypothetical protein
LSRFCSACPVLFCSFPFLSCPFCSMLFYLYSWFRYDFRAPTSPIIKGKLTDKIY